MPHQFLEGLVGALCADALAMPVHWYYNRAALLRDYGTVERYLAPKNPHADSILWRSKYTALNEKGDILHDQARYWGQRGVHYHQFLKAGENTLNLQLARELYGWIRSHGGYSSEGWLRHYADFMLTAGRHRDTYVEECHRGFFTRYAQGKPLAKCGIRSEHIGGLAQVPALMAACGDLPLGRLRAVVKEHVGSTHAHPNVLRAADTFVRVCWTIREGASVREAITKEAGDWISGKKAEGWAKQPDEHVVGERFSTACYIAEAMPASLYLAWKYENDFVGGIVANANVGGDSCHRGVVVGGILGLACGVPKAWSGALLVPPPELEKAAG
ncbi:MAG: ADP-ribosylglycohydrolase family protein [Verrucomicrobia bacterium]|nr:ADP-ribosylglycohydrolase family protein [Verrucomicrobiota bacterium]